jgi:hypothetical protein
MANYSAQQFSEAGDGTLSAVAVTTNGIAEITWPTGPGSEVAITNISKANGAVALTGTTTAIGDIVRIYDSTDMYQIASMDFTVTAVNAGVSITLGYLNSTGFADVASAAKYRKVSDLKYYPRKRYITAITAGATTDIQLSVTCGYSVNEYITVYCTSDFGMSEINGKTGKITAVNTTTNTITVDIDSSTFTAFAFPTSAAAAAGVTFPTTVPAGEFATILTQAYVDKGAIQIYLGSSVVGANGKVMDWVAYKGELID